MILGVFFVCLFVGLCLMDVFCKGFVLGIFELS